jgi:hypothetical protein
VTPGVNFDSRGNVHPFVHSRGERSVFTREGLEDRSLIEGLKEGLHPYIGDKFTPSGQSFAPGPISPVGSHFAPRGKIIKKTDQKSGSNTTTVATALTLYIIHINMFI